MITILSSSNIHVLEVCLNTPGAVVNEYPSVLLAVRDDCYLLYVNCATMEKTWLIYFYLSTFLVVVCREDTRSIVYIHCRVSWLREINHS